MIMSDLISRSELYMNDLIRRKDVLALFPTNDCSDKMVGLYERVLDIPTAYDVSKVAAELYNAESVKLFGSLNSGNRLIPVSDAIEIVKRGGVE